MAGFAHNLQHMGLLPFALITLAVTAFTLYCFYLIWRNFRRANLIDDTPRARVRSAPQGYVELQGLARTLPGQPVVAPLTHSACVWYRFKIERERNDSRSGSRWSEVESGTSETPFLFCDDTGECLVDPRRAEVTPLVKKVWYGRNKWPNGAGRPGLLGALLGSRYRYTEERIDGGEVYVLGWFDTLRSTDRPVREEVAATLKNWKQDQSALLRRFDANGDGHIDEKEWQVARHSARREVLAGRAVRSAEPATNVVRAGAHDDYPLLISARPERLLSDRYRRRAWLALAGSAGAAGALAWMFAVRGLG